MRERTREPASAVDLSDSRGYAPPAAVRDRAVGWVALPAASFALILIAFTAPVAPACSVNPSGEQDDPERHERDVRSEQQDPDPPDQWAGCR